MGKQVKVSNEDIYIETIEIFGMNDGEGGKDYV